MRISDWSSDVCSSDLPHQQRHRRQWIGERHWFGRFALGGLNREMIMRGVLAGLARSEAGAVAPTVALSLFGLIAAGGLAFDYARLASLDTELQNAADHAALAAASQDRKSTRLNSSH